MFEQKLPGSCSPYGFRKLPPPTRQAGSQVSQQALESCFGEPGPGQKMRPVLAAVERCGAKFGQHWPNFDRDRPELADSGQVGQQWPMSG